MIIRDATSKEVASRNVVFPMLRGVVGGEDALDAVRGLDCLEDIYPQFGRFGHESGYDLCALLSVMALGQILPCHYSVMGFRSGCVLRF
jgi:hypothetical protein